QKNIKPNHKPKRSRHEIISGIVEWGQDVPPGQRLALSPALNATSEERGWVLEHLTPFFDGKSITSVLRRVKGGKEANVYCCAAHPSTGLDLIAAKLYRPRLLRNLKNDSQYRLGRPMLNAAGEAISQSDWRMHKAIQQKSRVGREAQQTSWLEYEYQTLKKLHEAGADVPAPLRHGDHALLMEYVGNEVIPAPILNQVALEQGEAQPLFERLMRNVELMLQCGFVHGDMSAYNVLYWQGEIKIIDFPQVMDPRGNPNARVVFRRDVLRLCQYFAKYGVISEPLKLAEEMWMRHKLRDE
ncbi:MAG: RIO1 family regulatory kinase/ATPase, partial [Chloroflexota bacterium]